MTSYYIRRALDVNIELHSSFNLKYDMKTQQRLDRLHAHEALRAYRRRKRKGEQVSISSIAREFNISPRALQRRNRVIQPHIRQNEDGSVTGEDMTSLGTDIQTPTSAEELQFGIVHEYLTRHEEELGPLRSPMRMILETGSRVIPYFRGPIPPLQISRMSGGHALPSSGCITS